ncbi:MAG: flavodoxin family protein [Anaerolineae bacterium]|nr:flavodoxin family protein [Anaerolineae bacterium]
MKALVVYDSFFGNTEKIAKAIGGAFDPQTQVEVVRASEVKPEQLEGVELLVVGSPTRQFRASEATLAFLNSLPPNSLKGKKAAAFDTRVDMKKQKSWLLRLIGKLFRYAAEPIGAALEKSGGKLVLPPEGFFVEDTEGPLREGELERAAAWAKSM